MANCWGGFTVYQMACILILIVGIPFLIALIVVYIIYGLGDYESGSCAVFCCYLQGGLSWFPTSSEPHTITDQDIVIEDYTTPTSLPVRSVDFPTEEEMLVETDNPSVGALLENLYHDDHEDTIFKCPVAIISNQWALTTDHCVKTTNLSVRVNSRYWSTGGSVRKVKDTIYLKKSKKPSLALIRFEETNEVSPVKIAHFSDIYAKSYSWTNSFNNHLMKRTKYDKLKSMGVEFFQKDDCIEHKKPKHISCYITRKNGHCGGQINAPIIDSYNHLVGVHLETLCEDKKKYSVIFYIGVADFNVTINTVVQLFS